MFYIINVSKRFTSTKAKIFQERIVDKLWFSIDKRLNRKERNSDGE